MSHADTLNVEFPAAQPPGRDDLMVLLIATTLPADRPPVPVTIERLLAIMRCRGIFAVCEPHGQSHFVWFPVSLTTVQPFFLSARLTSL